jgi:hypothetical protein
MVRPMKIPSTPPVNRIVLLGASNLIMSLPIVIETTRRVCGGPSEFLIAAGHGRSYGVYSRVLLRGLPGIIECGLWDELAKGPNIPTFALVTDLGNDIGYGKPPERLIEWVSGCLDRLAECDARIIVTALPLPSLEHLSPSRYRFFRTLLFPELSLSWEQVLGWVREADQALREICGERGIPLIEQRQAWYGADPVHLRWDQRPSAYLEILKPWLDPVCAAPLPVKSDFRDRWRCWRLRPQYRCVLGVDQHHDQPCGVLPEGSTVSLY